MVLVYDPGCHFKNVRLVCIKQCRETKITRQLALLHEHHREGLPLLFRWQKFGKKWTLNSKIKGLHFTLYILWRDSQAQLALS